jgi:hypothetical protein
VPAQAAARQRSTTLQEHHLQQQEKILDEKNIAPAALTGTGKMAELLKKML